MGGNQILLLEQVALTPVREMPVNAAARIMEITDKRLWRVGYPVSPRGYRGLPAFASLSMAGSENHRLPQHRDLYDQALRHFEWT